MSISSIGDLARGLSLRQQGNILKQQLARLTDELSTGKTTDPARHLAGDFSSLADARHRRALLDSYAEAARQGRTDTSVMQTALSRVRTDAQRLGEAAITYATSPGANAIAASAREARGTLGDMLGALNVSVAGRALFAGDSVGASALASPDDFLTAIRAAAAGAATAADVTAAMDAFFDTPGGGFDTVIYQGSTEARAAYPLGEGEAVTLDLHASDPALRSTLKQVAITALLDDPGIALARSDRIALLRGAGESLLTSEGRIGAIEADLGFAQERIDRASSRIAAETAGLDMLETELLGIDAFEAATELESVQVRMETLYTITARNARLNLVNFLP